MKEQDLDSIFRKIAPALDAEEPAAGHRQRFIQKLEAQNTKVAKGVSWWKPLSIAASVLFIFGIFMGSITGRNNLEEISPEVSNTERYFASVISGQLTQLEKEDTPEARKMVSDVIAQLDLIESDYRQLKTNLIEGGDQKLILSAMIENFQLRIDLLEDVIEKIESIKKLKVQNNESNTL